MSQGRREERLVTEARLQLPLGGQGWPPLDGNIWAKKILENQIFSIKKEPPGCQDVLTNGHIHSQMCLVELGM